MWMGFNSNDVRVLKSVFDFIVGSFGALSRRLWVQLGSTLTHPISSTCTSIILYVRRCCCYDFRWVAVPRMARSHRCLSIISPPSFHNRFFTVAAPLPFRRNPATTIPLSPHRHRRAALLSLLHRCSSIVSPGLPFYHRPTATLP